MAAPTPTARGTPSGIKLRNGFRTLITFATNPTIEFWEMSVKPPGIDGGEAIEQTTMHNVTWRTKTSRSLKTLTDASSNVEYDPLLYTSILALINVETTVTVTFPDGTTLAFFGFLQKFEPGELKEGDPPTAGITIIPTNYDPTGHVEAAPVLTNVSGT